jgi:hypothetical protein
LQFLVVSEKNLVLHSLKISNFFFSSSEIKNSNQETPQRISFNLTTFLSTLILTLYIYYLRLSFTK